MLGAPGRLFVAGVDHRATPLAVREALTPPDAAIPALLQRLALPEALILVTCDRVELLGSAGDDAGARAAFRLLGTELPVEPYVKTGHEALRHLCRVAASLDAQVIGEPFILGQVKAADRLASSAGTVGPVLRRALDIAYRAAKRVRSETAIAEHPVSLAAVAVQAACDVQGDLSRRNGLLLGGGEMGEYLADQLRLAGLTRWQVAARVEAQARAAAQRLGGHVVDFTDLLPALAGADVVVTAIGSGRVAIDKPLMRETLRRRRNRPMLLVDAGQPADIAIATGELDQAFLYTLDDLESVAMRGRRNRAAAQDPALAIIEHVLAAAWAEDSERGAVPVVVALRDHAESLRQAVLAEAGADAERATSLLLARLLHRPSTVLRDSAGSAEDLAGLDQAVRRLFGLPGGNPGRFDD